ncbi:MAG: hypothetical protein QF893_11295 [Alphaproteobacteria bacterium]|nr:hypothetical protein [Alphaproteobacteria bacterium]
MKYSGFGPVVCLSILLGLNACAFQEQISDHAVQYNKAVEEAHNAQMILNILRASDRRPMHFTAVTKVLGRLTLTTAGGIGITIPFGGDAASTFPLSPEFSVTQQSSPSFDVGVLDKQDFMRGILLPIETSTFQFYWNNRWPPEVLIYTLFDRVVGDFCNDGEEKDCVNSPPDLNRRGRKKDSKDRAFDRFQEWVKKNRSKITIRTKISGTPIGPSVDFSRAENLNAFIKVIESEKTLTIFEDPLVSTRQRLCEVSKSLHFVVGPFDQDSAVEMCVEKVEEAVEDKEKALMKEAKKEKGESVEMIPAIKQAIPVRPDEPEKQGQPELRVAEKKGSIHLHSVQSVLYYLGEAYRNEMRIRSGPDKSYPLFALTEDPDLAAKPVIRAEYNGKTYYVPAGDEGGRTLTVLALLNQIMGLHKKSEELPVTRAVETVGQ